MPLFTLFSAAQLVLASSALGANCAPVPSGLAGWWSGDAPAYDLAGAHHGTLSNGARSVPGKVGNAFQFDGVDDYVDVGSWSPGSQWTVEAWVNPSATPSGRRGIAGGANECRDWGLTMQDGRFGALIRQPGGCTQSLTNTVNAAPGFWYHLASACDGSNVVFYVNGAVVASGPVDTNYVATAWGVRIGGEACCSNATFPGLIDEVGIYSRALSQAEVLTVFTAGEAGKCRPALTGPVDYWQWAQNEHWYRTEIVGAGGISWKDAQAAAQAAGGYLATITSEEENNAVFSLAKFAPQAWFNFNNGRVGPWLGGFQPDGSPEPSGGWTWVTRELFSFSNWASGEPNNSGGSEHWLHYYTPGGLIAPTWNDLPNAFAVRSYMIEFETTPIPRFAGGLSATAVAGKPFGYRVSALNHPTGFGATGLPAGLTVDTQTGEITGTPGASGVFPVALRATNAVGMAAATLQLSVLPQNYAAGAVLFTNAASLLADNLAHEWSDVTVSNCTLTLNGIHQFNSLTVISNGVVAHPAATNSESFSLWLVVGNTLTVDPTSKIDVSGRGYQAGRTVVNSATGAAGGRTGGSYGGLGLTDAAANLSWTYGDFRNPQEPGSGGGTDLGNAAGGGLARIQASTVVLEGKLVADGASGFDYYNRAAGSGGGIRLDANTLRGSGSITANGGDGSQDGGSGGGGRVAIYYGDASGFNLNNISARGGNGGRGPGAVGTVYLRAAGTAGLLRIESQRAPTGMWTPLGRGSDDSVDLSGETLLIAGTNVVVKPEHQMPIKAMNLTVTSGAVLAHQPTTIDREFSLLLTIGNELRVDESARIDASGLGYGAGVTVGNAQPGAAAFRAGGSHGGLGSPNGTSNATYGDFRNPNELGSGGGPDLGNGNGGGLVRLSAKSLILNGAIAVNGKDGFDYYNRAAGSGGGIRIDVAELRGVGAIQANGGNGTQDGGSGGGGRVAIYYASASGFDLDKITTHGGSGGSGIGAVGTVYFKPDGGQPVLRLDNHGGTSGSWTPLGLATDAAFDLGLGKLVISGTNIVVKPAHQMPVNLHDLVIQKQATLTHLPTTAQQEFSLLLTVAGTASIDASSRIDVSSLGYAAGVTAGNTNLGGTTFHAGGSYGGLGSANGVPNRVYGDFRNPNELGSGGGPDLGHAAGGGLARITANTLVLDGLIAAKGQDGFDYYNRGAGSGGGIRIDVESLQGAGAIQANGGNGSQDGGSGGGGRIALYYSTASAFNLDRVTAHGGNGGSGIGAVGTVYLKPRAGQAVLRLDNHGGVSGSWTPLGIASDRSFDLGPDKLIVAGTNIIVKPEHQMLINVHDLALQKQSILTHLPTTPEQEFSLLLTVTGALSVDASSRIDANGLGYTTGLTLGNTNTGAATFRAGGSYGGLGAPNGVPNRVYGDYRNPNELGSGGGSDLGKASGGGLLRILAGSLLLDGWITADGKDGDDYYNRAGGSGGGIWVSVDSLAGVGTIHANGGKAVIDGGSGGGGRVALYYGSNRDFNLEQVTAHGGNGGSGAGAVGSVYLKNKTGEGVVRFDNHGTPSGSWIPLGISTSTGFDSGEDQVVISGDKMIVKPEHQMPLVFKSLTLEKGATLTHLPTTTDTENSLLLTVVETLKVDATSRIDVSSLGYGAGVTEGNRTQGGATGRAGGSYGGLGTFNGTPNATYGDYHNPNELGSGGGPDLGNGNGGGLARIMASSLILDGLIAANGKDGFDYYNRAGGSGGGIWISVNHLSGSGAIRANGGNGTIDGGNGGGGRIAIYYRTNGGYNFDQITAHGGRQGDNPGAVGTIYLKSENERGVLRLDSHGGATGSWTPLGVDGQDAFDAREEIIVISGTNVVAKPAFQLPILAYALALSHGAQLTHRPASADQVFSLDVQVTDRTEIDAPSRIDVSGIGYVAGRTSANSADGAAVGRSGGSYGGMGGVGSFGAPNSTYGDPRNPVEPGSGSGLDLGQATGGGLARLITGSLSLDGAIRAQGANGFDYYHRPGGSGGGILISTGTLLGQGTITANGGGAWGDGGAGGGGRIALYVWQTNALPMANIATLGGRGEQSTGQVGTVFVATSPLFFWQNTNAAYAHGVWPLRWMALGANPAGVAVDVIAFRNGVGYPILAGQPSQGDASWDTSAVPDGEYELRAVFRNASHHVMGEATRKVTVVNAAQWHSGVIASAETWSPASVHIVEGNLRIDNKGLVTIPPGVTVKFSPGARITILKGGTLNAQGAAGAPVIFTALPDDDAGGDTNLDGDKSRPQPGEWSGVNTETGGVFNKNDFVEFRYLRTEHKGTLSKSETWLGTFLHLVSADVVIPNGVTLTVEPGAVLKFNRGVGVTVQSGGQLLARGGVALPITFTSARDDATGGDSNGDGDTTQPTAGDWRWILLDGGKAEFDHCQLRYGGGPAEGGWGPSGGPGKASVKVQNNGSLLFANSVLEDSFFDGLLCWGGPVKVTSSVFTGIDRAVCAHPGSVVEVVNCTLDDNRVGLLIHGGEMRVTNTIVAGSFTAGILHDYGPDALTIVSSDLWNPTATSGNYYGTTDQTGRAGNLAVDPKFRDASRRNLRLKYLSPCIDAANGAAAPGADIMGAPRYDDPHVNNTGTAAAGAFADLGAFEFVETANSDLDLVVDWVSGPSQVRAGERVKVQWSITNAGKGRAIGPWHDALALVADSPQREVTRIEVAEAMTSATLGPNESQIVEAEVDVPGGTEGVWRWQITANARGEIFEGRNWANNASPLSAATELRVPELTMGTAIASSFVDVNRPAWFKFHQSAGVEALVVLDAAAMTGRVRLYAGFDSMPTESDFNARSGEWNSADARLGIASASQERTVYLLLVPEALGQGVKDFSLKVGPSTFNLAGIGLAEAGNVGPVTIALLGSGFSEGLTAQLRASTGTGRIDAQSVQRLDSANALATFNLAGAPTGVYHVVVSQQGLSTSQNNALTVKPGVGGRFQATLALPPQVRVGRAFQCVLEFGNVGDTDLPVPLIYVQSSGNHPVWIGSKDDEVSQTVLQVLAIPEEGPVFPMIRPGEKHRVAFFSKLLSGGSVSYSVNWIEGDSMASMDWNAARTAVRPASADAAWDQAWTRLVNESGPTVGSYVAAMVRAAAELRAADAGSRNPGALMAYLVDQQLSRATDASLRGTLHDATGQKPLSDQTIILNGSTPQLQFVVQTSPDGSFAFRGVPAGAYSVEAPGYLPDPLTSVQVPSATPLNLSVSSGGKITGRIASLTDDAPVVGAVVNAFNFVASRNYSGTTGTDGRYAITGLPPGAYEMQVLAEQFAPSPGQILDVVGEETLTLSLSLLPGSSLRGTVRNAAGSGVTGAWIQALPVTGQGGRSAVADAQGRFTIAGLTPGVYRVLAGAASYGPVSLANVPVPFASGTLDLSLSAPAALSGAVKDARTGLPIAGATVATDAAAGAQSPNLTDAQGRFTIRDAAAGAQNLIVAASHYVTTIKPVTLNAGSTASADVTLRALGTITGRVLGAGGAALAGIDVSLVTTNGPTASVVTSARGEFQFADLPDGAYELGTGSPAGLAVGRRSFTLNAARNAFDTTIELGGVELNGRVLRSDATSAAPQVRVDLRRSGKTIASALADEKGSYRFLVFGPANVDITATGAEIGFIRQDGVSVGGGNQVTAPNLVAGKSALRVTVQSAGTGAPVANAWVTLRPASAFPEGYYLARLTDALGAATFSNLAEQTYDVDVSAPGRASQTTRVALSGASVATTVALGEGCVVQGLVTDDAGRPIPGALVTCVEGSTKRAYSVFTGTNGRYAINWLPAGAFDVWALTPSLTPVRITGVFTVAAVPRSVNLTLPVNGAILQGRVVNAAGQALPSARIQVLTETGQPLKTTLSDASGHYELGALPASIALEVRSSADGMPDTSVLVVLSGTESVTQDFTVSAPAAIALGTGTPATLARSQAPTHAGLLAFGLTAFDSDFTAQTDVELQGIKDRFNAWWNSTSDFWTSFPKPTRSSEDTPEWRTGFRNLASVNPKCSHYARYQAVLRDTESSLKQVDQNFASWVSAHEALKESNKANLGLAAAQATKMAAKLAAFAVTLEGTAAALGSYGVVAGEATIVEYAASVISLLQNATVNTINSLQDDNFDRTTAGIESMLDLASDLADKASGTPLLGPIWLVVSSIKDLAEAWTDTKDSLRDHYNLISIYRSSQNAYIASLTRHWVNLNTLQAVVSLPCPGSPNNPPPPLPGKPGALASTSGIGSYDPNDKLTVGYGSQGFVASGAWLVYTIRFENKTNATAPAQRVVVTDRLDPKLDWSTFELMNLGFNRVEVSVPPGLSHYTTTTSVATDPDNDVDVQASLNPDTGVIQWTIESIDPITDMPPEDPFAGFLPPNDSLRRGEGYVSYGIRARGDSTSAMVITNMARIVFDVNPPIDTPMVTNTVDLIAPVSTVEPLPAISAPSFEVRWNGSDTLGGSGLNAFDVYVSRDGGPYALWLAGVTNTSRIFAGEANASYAFFSLAADAVGNREAPPVSADATTRTTDQQPPVTGPELSWSATANTITLYWPASMAGYQLEASPNPADRSGWTPVANPVVVIGSQNSVTYGLTGQYRFFRLRK